MSLLTSKDLTRLTGHEAKQFYVYRQRGQLVRMLDKKHYDDQNPINQAFLTRYSKDDPVPIQLENSGSEKTADTGGEIKIPKGEQKQLNFISQIELEQKKLNLEKTKKDIENKEIQIKQLIGSLVSLEKTTLIVKSYSENLQRELLINMQTFIQDICARHAIDPGKTGEYKLQTATLINRSNKISVEKLLKEFTTDG